MKHHFYKGHALDEGLRSIYEIKGKLPDMTRLEHEYHRRTTRILAGLIAFFAVLTAASWAGFFLYGPHTGSGKEVELSFDAPEAVVAGVPQTVTLTYRNVDKNPLALANLSVRLPAQLVLQDATPASQTPGRLEWNLGTLLAKSSGTITLTVVPYGRRDEPLELRTFLNYKPANFNAEFQTSASHTFTIRAGAVALTFDAPEKVVPGHDIEMKVAYENQTDQGLSQVQATLVAPGAFTLASSDPKADNDMKWNLGALAPGQKGVIALIGSVTSTASGALPLTIRFERVTEKSTLLLEEATVTPQIDAGAVVGELLLGDGSGKEWVRLGDGSVPFTVRVSNKSDKPLESVFVTLSLRSALLDFSAAKATTSTVSGEAMLRLPATGTLTVAPRATIAQAVSVKTVASVSSATSPVIEAQAEIITADGTLKTNALKVLVVSDLSLKTEARYFGADGKPVGSGPLPPKAGEETTFELRLRVHNTFHDLSNIVITAPLPKGVRFAGAAAGQATPMAVGGQTGKVRFNETTREVRFEIPRLPVTESEASIAFKVAVRPDATDRGQLMALLGVSRVEALDTIAQITFSADAPPVSTALEGDPTARGKGVVQ